MPLYNLNRRTFHRVAMVEFSQPFQWLESGKRIWRRVATHEWVPTYVVLFQASLRDADILCCRFQPLKRLAKFRRRSATCGAAVQPGLFAVLALLLLSNLNRGTFIALAMFEFSQPFQWLESGKRISRRVATHE
jgi:hypothetical protein